MFSVLSIVLCGTLLISIFARGYRLDTDNGFKLKATGLLSATSKPKSAKVYINDILTTATDDTINLPPGEYRLQISKDGYLPWNKTIKIQKELVYQTETQLFRAAPDLKTITPTIISHSFLNQDATKIIFFIASTSATQKAGLYLFEPSEYIIQFSDNLPKLLIANSSTIDWSKYTYQFSPNSKQLLASSKNFLVNYLLPLDQTITSKNIIDITPKLVEIKKQWENDRLQILKTKMEKIPKIVSDFVSTSSSILALSSDENKILYQASQSGSLLSVMGTPPPTQSTQAQTRDIKKDFYYVYDLKDDTNYSIGDSSLSSIVWLPNSNYLLFTQNKSVSVVEYDNTNRLTLYTGNNIIKNILPSSDGNKIILALDKLYSLTIRDR